MDGTGWGQRVEAVTDEPRLALLAAMSAPNRQGGITVTDPDGAMLARLYFEADHCQQGYLYGDHDPDTYADYRAGQRLKNHITAIDSAMTYAKAVAGLTGA